MQSFERERESRQKMCTKACFYNWVVQREIEGSEIWLTCAKKELKWYFEHVIECKDWDLFSWPCAAASGNGKGATSWFGPPFSSDHSPLAVSKTSHFGAVRVSSTTSAPTLKPLRKSSTRFYFLQCRKFFKANLFTKYIYIYEKIYWKTNYLYFPFQLLIVFIVKEYNFGLV